MKCKREEEQVQRSELLGNSRRIWLSNPSQAAGAPNPDTRDRHAICWMRQQTDWWVTTSERRTPAERLLGRRLRRRPLAGLTLAAGWCSSSSLSKAVMLAITKRSSSSPPYTELAIDRSRRRMQAQRGRACPSSSAMFGLTPRTTTPVDDDQRRE